MKLHNAPRVAPEPDRVRLGVLTNPEAQHNSRFPFTHHAIGAELASTLDAVRTATKAEIDDAVRSLVADRGVNVLAINGGDGTIHGVVNALARLLGDDVDAGRARLPRLLILNGGTYNMASRAMGTKADPVTTVRAFLARYGEAAPATVPTRPIGLMDVAPAGRQPMLGMVFGSQVIRNVLSLCDELGSGYLGLASLLARGSAGAVLRTGFWKEHRWRLQPADRQAVVDGRRVDGVTAVVASTIDLKLVRGLVWALAVPPEARGFTARLIRTRSSGELVRLLPALLWELPHPLIWPVPEARHLVTSGDFTVDGELYEAPGRVEVGLSRFSLDVVSGEDL
jgi:hypothetical protein